MGEFIIAHKLALLLIGAAIGGFVLLTRNKGAQAANGIPVNPYNANSPAGNAGGSFDLSSLLPSGPAGPVLDPTPGSSTPAATDTSQAPTAGETPAAIDNAPAAPSFSPTLTTTPPASGDYYVVPATDGQPTSYLQPTGYFQNEQGFQKMQVLNVSSGGQQTGTVSIAATPYATASDLYAAAGYKASDPVTLTPSSGPGTGPAVSLPIPDPMPYARAGTAVAF